MSRTYSVVGFIDATNAMGNFSLVQIIPADDHPCKLARVQITNLTEVAEAQEEMLDLEILRLPATVTAGSGGTAVAANAIWELGRSGSNPSFTARYGDTTPASTSGTEESLEKPTWNVRASPLDLYYPKGVDERYGVKQGEELDIRCNTAVADNSTFRVTVWVEEE